MIPPQTLQTRVAAMFTVTILLLRPGVSAGTPQLKSYEEVIPGSVVKLNMVAIPGGSITIGGKQVKVKPFYIADTSTPWEAFDVFLQSGPASKAYDQTKFPADVIARPSKSYILPDLGWGHHGFPTINVSIDSVTMYCRWLASVTKKKYRLPTEAEWELACRAGQTGPWKTDTAGLDKIAWYATNSGAVTHSVAKKQPNAFGLYDMLGDVGNWAIDLNGKPVLCGAAYNTPADQVSPSARKYWDPSWQEEDPQIPKSRWWLSDGSFVGFRVVCEP